MKVPQSELGNLPDAYLEWTAVPFTTTSKFPVRPSSFDKEKVKASAPNSLFMVSAVSVQYFL